jgi:Mat/Ecp fimbriae periplasmic chaperone
LRYRQIADPIVESEFPLPRHHFFNRPPRRRQLLTLAGTGLAWLTIVFAGPARAGAEIFVGAMHHYITPKRATTAKQIHNSGSATAFVRVDVVETDVAGKPLPAGPAEGILRDGLLASPSRLIIPAGGSQSVRMIVMGDRSRERYFRVRFVPVPPVREHGFAVTAAEVEAFKAQATTAINVLVGYGVRVVTAPTPARFDTRIDDVAGTITNAGDSTIFLRDHYVCTRPKRCESPVTERLAPGTGLRLAVDGLTHRFTLQEGDDEHAVAVPASSLSHR